MRRSKELVVLLVTFAALAVFVLWYVGQRRAENRARAGTTPAVRDLGPVRATPPAAVDLATHEGKTVDFSSGQPVVSDSPADRAALDAGLKDIEEARRNVTFEAPKKDEPKRP